jgi:hypothetical protein
MKRTSLHKLLIPYFSLSLIFTPLASAQIESTASPESSLSAVAEELQSDEGSSSATLAVSTEQLSADFDIDAETQASGNEDDPADPLALSTQDTESPAASPNSSAEPPSITPSSVETSTGDAVVTATATAEVNTTVIGSAITTAQAIHTDPSQQTTLVAPESPCTEPGLLAELPSATLSNTADLQTNIAAAADTGSTTLSGHQVDLVTGTASATVQVTHIANTSLIGNCAFYGMLSVYSPYYGTLLLPNEEVYAIPHSTSSPEMMPEVAVWNEAAYSASASSSATTGSNQTAGIGEVNTGLALTTTDSILRANETIIGSSWVLVQIFNPQFWHGSFANPLAVPVATETGIAYWLPFGAAQSTPLQEGGTISITNSAASSINASATANTGNNHLYASGGTLNTGSALTYTQLLAVLNTTLVGNNWYHLSIHLFDNFWGAIAFARPELYLQAPAQLQAQPGKTTTGTFIIGNAGTSTARQVTVAASSSSEGISVQAAPIEGDITAQKQVAGTLTITVSENLEAGSYPLALTVQNQLTEDNPHNNSVTMVLYVSKPHTPSSQPSTAMAAEIAPDDEINYTKKYLPVRASAAPSLQQQPAAPAILGIRTEMAEKQQPPSPSQLMLNLPLPDAKSFCTQYWELCSIAGLMVTTTPYQAWKRKRFPLSRLLGHTSKSPA